MTPEEVQQRMKRVAERVASMDSHRRDLAIQAGLLDRRFARARDDASPAAAEQAR